MAKEQMHYKFKNSGYFMKIITLISTVKAGAGGIIKATARKQKSGSEIHQTQLHN